MYLVNMSQFDRSLVGACDGLNASVLKSTNYSRDPVDYEKRPRDPIHSVVTQESELSTRNDKDQLATKRRLSAEFSDSFTTLIAVLIIATMGILAYGNTQRGAHVVLTITLEPPVPANIYGATPVVNDNGVTSTPSQDQFDNMSLRCAGIVRSPFPSDLLNDRLNKLVQRFSRISRTT